VPIRDQLSGVTLHAVVALIAVFLQAASAGVMFFIARAPGWERVRLMAAIALTAGVYSAVDVWFYVAMDDLALRAMLVRVNLFVAAVHAAMWMRFTFADATGRIGSMPRWTRWTTGTMLVTLAAVTAGDLVLDYGAFTHVRVPSLGLDERTYAFNTTGDLAALFVLSLIGVSLVQHLRRSQRGEPGATGIVIGLTLYALCILEEALVASGALTFMYLGSPGYVFAVLPLTIQLLERFGSDARRLAELSAHLSTEVEVRTVERDEARESLLEQQRLAALGRLAAGVGHEINNPLQYVLFHLEELQQSVGPTLDEANRAALASAVDGAHRIGRVVSSLRTYGVRQERFRRVPVTSIVEAALRIAAPRVRHDATLQVDVADVPDVYGDEGQLVQMLVNPLVNAAEALANSDAVRKDVVVSVRQGPDGWVVVTIADTGPGFDLAVLPRLGEPYVTTRAFEGGTGLGLFVTRGLVDAHGGRLVLLNGVNGGAEVQIHLPPAPAASTTAMPTDSASSDVPSSTSSALRDRAHVLVVDDEPMLLAVMQRLLERMGHRVTTVADGEAALTRVAREHFDVIITDLMMPGMSGLTLAGRLERDHPDARNRLVVMTGGAVTEADTLFLSRDDVEVMSKPVGRRELETVVAKVMAATPATRRASLANRG